MNKFEYMKEFGDWIWRMINKIYVFIQKPLGGIFMLLVFVVVSFIYSDYKFQEGYDSGIENQSKIDEDILLERKSTIQELKEANRILQAKNDTLKEPDCLKILKRAEEARDYIMLKAQTIKEINNSKKIHLIELESEIEIKENKINKLTLNH